MALITAHRALISNGMSQNIWHDLPISDMLKDPACVHEVFDDFVNIGDLGAGSLLSRFQTVFAQGGTGDVQQRLHHDGYLRVTTGATDEDQASLVTAGGVGGDIEISDTAGEGYALWFEARVSLVQITDQGWFLGFAEEGMSANDALFPDGSATMQDKDYVGFRILSGTPTAIDIAHNKESGGGEVVVETGAQTAVAGTFYKLGMKYMPIRSNPLDGKILRFYIDGVETASITSLPSTFPDAQLMAFLATLKTGTTAARSFDVDWVRWAHLRTGR